MKIKKANFNGEMKNRLIYENIGQFFEIREGFLKAGYLYLKGIELL